MKPRGFIYIKKLNLSTIAVVSSIVNEVKIFIGCKGIKLCTIIKLYFR